MDVGTCVDTGAGLNGSLDVSLGENLSGSVGIRLGESLRGNLGVSLDVDGCECKRCNK